MLQTIENARKEIVLLKTEARNSENKLRSFFESSSVIHLLIDTDLRLMDFNRAAVNFIKKYHEINIDVDTTVTKFIHKDLLETFRQNYSKALSGIPIRTEQILHYSNDTIVWFITYEPAWDCDGNILGISFNAVDITEKVANEHKIVRQYHSLQEIAYIHSHNLRRPISNIMGIMNLFQANGLKSTKNGLLMLQRAIDELEAQILMIEKCTRLS